MFINKLICLMIILLQIVYVHQVFGLDYIFDTPFSDIQVNIKDNKGNLSLVKTNQTIQFFTDLNDPSDIILKLGHELVQATDYEGPMAAPIGAWDFVDLDWVVGLISSQKSVGLIWGEGIRNATGFLISPSLFITNHHVLSDKNQLENAKVTFNYQMHNNIPLKTETYHVNNSFFITNDNQDEFDYTIIKLKDNPGKKWGYITLNNINDNELLPPAAVNIIQHAGGSYKSYALHANSLIDISFNKLLHYTSDTLKGSSGSPLFDNKWNLIGLHHASTKPPIKINNEVIDTNEGILINKIIDDLKTKLKDDPEGKSILKELKL